jgi:hypothetical protein
MESFTPSLLVRAAEAAALLIEGGDSRATEALTSTEVEVPSSSLAGGGEARVSVKASIKRRTEVGLKSVSERRSAATPAQPLAKATSGSRAADLERRRRSNKTRIQVIALNY